MDTQLQKLREIFKDYTDMDVATINETTDLTMDLKIDSVDMVALIMTVEETFHVQIPDEVLTESRVVGDILNFLSQNAR